MALLMTLLVIDSLAQTNVTSDDSSKVVEDRQYQPSNWNYLQPGQQNPGLLPPPSGGFHNVNPYDNNGRPAYAYDNAFHDQVNFYGADRPNNFAGVPYPQPLPGVVGSRPHYPQQPLPVNVVGVTGYSANPADSLAQTIGSVTAAVSSTALHQTTY